MRLSSFPSPRRGNTSTDLTPILSPEQIRKISCCSFGFLGNGRNTVSRVLFRKRELTVTEFRAKLGEFCKRLAEFVLAHNKRLNGTH